MGVWGVLNPFSALACEAGPFCSQTDRFGWECEGPCAGRQALGCGRAQSLAIRGRTLGQCGSCEVGANCFSFSERSCGPAGRGQSLPQPSPPEKGENRIPSLRGEVVKTD